MFSSEARPPLASTIYNPYMACVPAPWYRLFWGCWGLISFASGILKVEHLILLSFCTYRSLIVKHLIPSVVMGHSVKTAEKCVCCTAISPSKRPRGYAVP